MFSLVSSRFGDLFAYCVDGRFCVRDQRTQSALPGILEWVRFMASRSAIGHVVDLVDHRRIEAVTEHRSRRAL